MRQQHEIGRYWTLIGYMDAFKRGGEYLDVGCGDGVLFERFKPLGYQRYVGIDISHVAIEKLRLHNDDRTNFTQADGDVHEAAGRFDVIIFNEFSLLLARPCPVARALRPVAQTGRLHHRLDVHGVAAIESSIAGGEARVRGARRGQDDSRANVLALHSTEAVKGGGNFAGSFILAQWGCGTS